MKYSGKDIAEYIYDITPDKELVPDSWIKLYVLPNDGWEVKKFKVSDLIDSDPAFAEYLDCALTDNYHRYIFDKTEGAYVDADSNLLPEIELDDIYRLPAVVYNGIVLDGYSRISEQVLLDEEYIYAYTIE
jgi:hypothetical protein